MTVVAGEGDEMTAWVGEGTRELVTSTLEAYSAAIAGDLTITSIDDRQRVELEERLELLGQLLRQVEGTAGPVHLSGPSDVVVTIVRATASQAVYELASLVEAIADGGDAPTGEEAVALVRARMAAANACVEALIACETSRWQA